jgi:hypothetical protein
MHCSVTWITYDCAVEYLVLWQAEKSLEKWIWRLLNKTCKNYVDIYVWRCGSSELWCSVTGQEVPAILKQAVKKSFLDWLHLKIKDATITYIIRHHSSSDKVSISQKTWVLKSTTVSSHIIGNLLSYLIPGFHRTKHIIWHTWKRLRISDTYYGFNVRHPRCVLTNNVKWVCKPSKTQLNGW